MTQDEKQRRAYERNLRVMEVFGGVVTGLFLAAFGTMVVRSLREGGAPEPGFVVLPNCGGFNVSDVEKAAAFARYLGGVARPYDPAAAEIWVTDAWQALGIPKCDFKAQPAALQHIWHLTRHYLRGALSAGRIPEISATVQAQGLRGVLLFGSSLQPADLPEGIPP